MCILPPMAFEAMATSKWPRRSFDLRFEISNLDYPGIHVHIASNGLRGHGDLLTTSEVIWPQIWNQQPWLPWYPCAYCLQWPPRPWRPPRPRQPQNDLRGHMTSDLSSATFITLVSMCILPLTASEAMVTSKRPRRSHPTSKFNSVTWITYVPMLLWPLNASSDSILPGGGGLPSIDLRGFAAGKNRNREPSFLRNREPRFLRNREPRFLGKRFLPST